MAKLDTRLMRENNPRNRASSWACLRKPARFRRRELSQDLRNMHTKIMLEYDQFPCFNAPEIIRKDRLYFVNKRVSPKVLEVSYEETTFWKIGKLAFIIIQL